MSLSPVQVSGMGARILMWHGEMAKWRDDAFSISNGELVLA
jgi:hypothetical protein